MYDGPLFDNNSKIDEGYFNIYLDKNGYYVVGNLYSDINVARQYSNIVAKHPMYGRKQTLYRIKLTPKQIWDKNPLA